MTDIHRFTLLDDIENSDLAWFWATDREGKLTYLSDNAARTFARSLPVVGSSWGDLVETVDLSQHDAVTGSLSALMKASCSFVDQPVMLLADCLPEGTEDRDIWWALTGDPHFDGDGHCLGYRGIVRDITGTIHSRTAPASVAESEAFIRTANRHRFIRSLDQALATYRAERRSCAILLVDLGRFGQSVEVRNKMAAEELLTQVSQRLDAILPDHAQTGRMGDVQFQIVLPDEEDRGKLGELASRIIQTLAKPYATSAGLVSAGISVGIAVAPFDGIHAAGIVTAAELALHAAKGAGRGYFRFYSSDLRVSADSQREMEDDLRDAMRQGQLEIHYQPIVDRMGYEVRGFEALMRWNHPERGLISPSVFMPVAENGSLIDALGEWAIRQACQDANRWPVKLRVAVNISMRQFADDRLIDIIDRALHSSGLAADRLELEISENVFTGDPAATDARIRQIRSRGVRVAIDDFGTGHASLANLSRTTVDAIKIDRSFVRGCAAQDRANRAIIAAVVRLASALEMETTAQGVEAMDELDCMARLSADRLQGFIFSRAIPQQQVVAALTQGRLRFEPAGPATQRSGRRAQFRRVGVVHEGNHYVATLRDLSQNSARLQGLLNVPVGTQLVLDLGEGQLVPATVSSSQDATQGLSFETPLVSDGAGGLCTRTRVSPYTLADMGMPLQPLQPGVSAAPAPTGSTSTQPRFMQVDMSSGSLRAG